MNKKVLDITWQCKLSCCTNLCFKENVLLSDELQGAQSETEAKQEIQQLHKELIEAQELARTSKQKCFELQGETQINLIL